MDGGHEQEADTSLLSLQSSTGPHNKYGQFLWNCGRREEQIKHSPGPLVQTVSTVSPVQKVPPFQSLHEIVLCLRGKEEGNGKFCLPQLSPVPVLLHGHL